MELYQNRPEPEFLERASQKIKQKALDNQAENLVIVGHDGLLSDLGIVFFKDVKGLGSIHLGYAHGFVLVKESKDCEFI